MKSEGAYWDDLGIEWRATDPEPKQVTPPLQARLRRQSLAITAAFALGIPLCGAGVILGVCTLWRGWTSETWNFVTRGVAIVVVSALLIRALIALLPFRAHMDIQSLAEMFEIAVARIRRTLFLVRMAIVCCVVAGVFGIVGTAIRIRAGSAPRLSPIVDLIIIALIISLLWLYGRTLSAEDRKFEYLRRTVGGNK